jgi:hypothetical protein
MALRRRNFQDDLRWLRGPVTMVVIVLAISIGTYVAASYYRNGEQRLEFNATTNLDLISVQVQDIEQEEQAVVNSIGVYNSMVANRVMGEEDRVGLLEEITQIRERYLLFPINVSIGEQDRLLLEYPENVDFPDDQITLRSSPVQVRFSLLHEEDLTRFLGDFLDSGRLMVPSNCTVSSALEDPDDAMRVVQHQIAACEFYWYTYQLEPYLGF